MHIMGLRAYGALGKCFVERQMVITELQGSRRDAVGSIFECVALWSRDAALYSNPNSTRSKIILKQLALLVAKL